MDRTEDSDDALPSSSAEIITSEEINERFNRALQMCSGTGQDNTNGNDSALAALVEDGSVSAHNNQCLPAVKYEINRLTTFRNWPSTVPVTPSALARAGFFYTGIADMVECFICHGQIRHFEYGDSAVGEHKKHFPNCPFVRNRHHGNVPMTGSPDIFAAELKEVIVNVAENQSKEVRQASKNNSNDMATEADNKAKSTFKCEFKRLLSYQNWPVTCPVDPRDCAKAGFFYTGRKDEVQCFACFGKIGGFKEGDVPMVEHNRYFPSCPYVMGLNVGNQPISAVQMANALQAIKYKPIPNGARQQPMQFLRTPTPAITFNGGGRNQRPNQKRVFANVRHPQFASEQARLESYDCWPPAVGLAPIRLARAGFFYTGTNDSCKCFCCDGGLKNWEPKDEPWMEHARWFPRCEWLIKQRGQAYIDYVVHNFPQPRVSNQILDANGFRKSNVESEGQNGAGPLGADVQSSRNEEPSSDKIEELMREKVAQTVLSMGYDPRVVRAVLRRRINNTNSSYINAQDLLEDIFDAEGNIELEGEPQPGNGDDDITSQFAKLSLKDTSPGQGDSPPTAAEAFMGNQGSNHGSCAPMGPLQIALPGSGEPQLPMIVMELKQELDRYRDSQRCKICMDKEMSTVFLPCNHMIACKECSQNLQLCPMCRKKIRNVVKIYKA